MAPGRALYDAFGKGFTLIDFGAPDEARRLVMAAQTRSVPVKILSLDRPAEFFRNKLLLIRPDQHIAWHGDRVADALAVIDRVRGS